MTAPQGAPPIRLRDATADDEAFLLEMTRRLADFPTPSWRTAAEIGEADHAILREALHRPGPETSIVIAEDAAGRRIGYVFSATRIDYFTAERHGHVENLAVVAGVEGMGIGRRLMEAAERWARGCGYRRMTLNVFHSNTRAQAVYHRLGYEPETLHFHKWLAAPPG